MHSQPVALLKGPLEHQQDPADKVGGHILRITQTLLPSLLHVRCLVISPACAMGTLCGYIWLLGTRLAPTMPVLTIEH